MGINPISPKINTIKGVQTAQTVSFGGALDKGAKTVEEVLNSRMPKSVKFMDKMRWVNSELGTILITALGTGLVAPIFIAFNPLSKADEKTKKYTAMRQPVSAVLAIFIQAGVTKPLNKLIGYLSKIGKLGKSPYFDTSNLKGADHYKEEFKKLGNTRLSAEEYAASKVKEEEAAIAKQLKEQGTIIFSADKKLEDKEVIKLINKTIDSYKAELKEQKEAISDSKISIKVKRAQLLSNPQNKAGIEQMCNALAGAKNEAEVNDLLNRLYLKDENPAIRELAEEFKGKELEVVQRRANKTIAKINLFSDRIEQCKFISENANALTGLLEQIKNNPNTIENVLRQVEELANTNPEKGVLLTDFVKRIRSASDAETKEKLLKNALEHISEIQKAGGDRLKIVEVYQHAYYDGAKLRIDRRLKILDSLKVADNATDVKGAMAQVEQGLKSLNKKNLVGDMVSTWKKVCSSRLRGLKQVTGLLIGVFVTLPITCHALNWVYPRFMDIFFPSLSKNSKSSAPDKNAKVKEGK